MKSEDQIKALAELDGLSERQADDQNCYAWFDGNRQISAWLNSDWRKPCPRHYLDSYDAIIPLIQKQDGETKNLVEDYIEECQTMKTSFWYDATPSQLCEALLRATGKWED